MIRLAVPVLLRIARSSVDGSPIRITFDTDLKVIRSSVNGVQVCYIGQRRTRSVRHNEVSVLQVFAYNDLSSSYQLHI